MLLENFGTLCLGWLVGQAVYLGRENVLVVAELGDGVLQGEDVLLALLEGGGQVGQHLVLTLLLVTQQLLEYVVRLLQDLLVDVLCHIWFGLWDVGLHGHTLLDTEVALSLLGHLLSRLGLVRLHEGLQRVLGDLA